MIKTFRSKALHKLFENGTTAGINQKYHKRCIRQLDVVHAAKSPREIPQTPGWEPHPLKGKQAGRYAISVSGPWRITFEYKDGDAYLVDFEQYH
jgi:proteic killer suppression protein